MSFDQNMIIDATTGSIARFVNHSCKPNCRMIKWIVSGQPRMALFAGDQPIMTGDELTYDYNFDPFSNKNVQTCLCGSENCRGVLGPRPREVKPPKVDLKKAVKGTIKAGKRKLKEMLGDDATDDKAKKRKIQPATGVKRSLSNASLKAAKGAATAIKKSVSSMSLAKKNSAKSTPVKRRASTGNLLKKATASKLVKGKTAAGKPGSKAVSSRSSSLTIVGNSEENARAGKKATTPKKGSPAGKLSTKGTPKGTPKSRASSIGGTPKSKTSPKGKVTPKTAHRRLTGKPKQQTAKPTIKLVDE